MRVLNRLKAFVRWCFATHDSPDNSSQKLTGYERNLVSKINGAAMATSDPAVTSKNQKSAHASQCSYGTKEHRVRQSEHNK